MGNYELNQTSEYGAKTVELTLPINMGTFLDEKASLLGDKPACIFFQEDKVLTYRELSEASNILANQLLNIGVRKGSHVAVMLPNISPFPITWFALAKIGAIIVPININYQPEELNHVLTDSDSQFFIIDESCCETFLSIEHPPHLLTDSNIIICGNGGKPSWLNWDQLCAVGDQEFTSPVAVTQSDLCNIQYTSGTTGLPKGCMLTHHYWLLFSHTTPLTHKDSFENFLITLPLFYMESEYYLLLTFYYNGTAYIARRHSASKFIDWVRKFHIHYCSFPEFIVRNTQPEANDADNELRFVNSFYYSKEAHLNLEKRFNVIGRDAFGMTEIGVGTIMPEEATHMVGTGSCGLQAPFRQLRVVDEDGKDLPRGEIGELWVAGPGLFWGYYKKPKANRESFHGKWFRTGDLVRQDADGYFYVVGRLKDMIKRSGENISALEVEKVLKELSEIEEAAVVPVPDEERKEEVKAYIILQEGLTSEDLSPEKIIAHCTQKLARFKVPRYISYAKEFPWTPSGKVAKKQLIDSTDDPRVGSFDRVDGIWR